MPLTIIRDILDKQHGLYPTFTGDVTCTTFPPVGDLYCSLTVTPQPSGLARAALPWSQSTYTPRAGGAMLNLCGLREISAAAASAPFSGAQIRSLESLEVTGLLLVYLAENR